MPKVYLKTYGCQMNVRDSEQVVSMFVERGYTMTDDESEADVLLINTCSIRDQAEQKALGKMGMLGKAHRSRQSLGQVVFAYMGCMAQNRGEELKKLSPHVNVVAGTQKYHRVVEYVEKIFENRRRKILRYMDEPESSLAYEDFILDIGEEENSQNYIKDHNYDNNFSNSSDGGDKINFFNGEDGKNGNSLNEANADGQGEKFARFMPKPKISKPSQFVSIMQGCNMKCAFCIVPYTRGSERSRPQAEVVAEVKKLASAGAKEVTLLGQIVNLYGRFDVGDVDKKLGKNAKSQFVDLLESVHEVDGIERIRFTSPHPVGFDDDLIKAFGYLPKMASHVHLPLQSGSDRILRKMKRPYKFAKFKDICQKLRQVRPDIAITTDVIVGFPGESEEDFQLTKSAIEEIGFDNAFVFRYSKRTGTPAAEVADEFQLPEEVKERRNKELLAILDEISFAKNQKLIGTRQVVLCEGASKSNPQKLSGRTSQNKIVIFEGDRAKLTGEMLEVKIMHTTDFTLYGEVC